jgi:hypothetical protein
MASLPQRTEEEGRVVKSIPPVIAYALFGAGSALATAPVWTALLSKIGPASGNDWLTLICATVS